MGQWTSQKPSLFADHDRWARRLAQAILAEERYLLEALDVKSVPFLDDRVTGHYGRVYEVCRQHIRHLAEIADGALQLKVESAAHELPKPPTCNHYWQMNHNYASNLPMVCSKCHMEASYEYYQQHPHIWGGQDKVQKLSDI